MFAPRGAPTGTEVVLGVCIRQTEVKEGGYHCSTSAASSS